MDAKVLRIGNKLMYNGEVVICYGIDTDSVQILKPNMDRYFHRVPILELKPIPITEEILFKCGFEKYGEYHDSYKNNPFIIELSILGEFYYFRKMINANESILLKEIKYLHELQNLYHSLTGKELEYNE